jgi:hypothetical protein
VESPPYLIKSTTTTDLQQPQSPALPSSKAAAGRRQLTINGIHADNYAYIGGDLWLAFD